jgi:hypothetical protein
MSPTSPAARASMALQTVTGGLAAAPVPWLMVTGLVGCGWPGLGDHDGRRPNRSGSIWVDRSAALAEWLGNGAAGVMRVSKAVGSAWRVALGDAATVALSADRRWDVLR